MTANLFSSGMSTKTSESDKLGLSWFGGDYAEENADEMMVPSPSSSSNSSTPEDEKSLVSVSPPVTDKSTSDWSLSVSKFLDGFRIQAAASLSNAYRTHHPLNKSVTSGIISTSLAEDVFFLIEVQLNVLHDFLKEAGILNSDTGENVIEDGLLAIFRCIWAEQTRHRNAFLTSFELCCATANDFFRMMTKVEDLMATLERKYPFLEWNTLDGDTKTEVIRREANDLETLFVSDAVYAAQSAHLFVTKSVRESSVYTDLFSRDWEDRYTHNEVMMNMIRVFEDYNNDLQNFLCTDYLYHKTIVALVRATVCYYIQALLNKTNYIRNRSTKKIANTFKSEAQRRRELPLECPARALCRMMHDIRILCDYFQRISKDSTPLTRVVANELNILTVVHEFLGLAVGHTGLDSLEEFIVVLHKRTGGDWEVTRCFLSDLWFLASPGLVHEQKRISVTMALMKAELDMVSERMKEKAKGEQPTKAKKDKEDIPPRIDAMLWNFYEDRIWQEKLARCGKMLRHPC